MKAGIIAGLALLWHFLEWIWSILIVGIIIGVLGNAAYTYFTTGKLNITDLRTLPAIQWTSIHFLILTLMLLGILALTVCSWLANRYQMKVAQERFHPQKEVNFKTPLQEVFKADPSTFNVYIGHIPTNQQHPQESTPTLWNVPYRRNPYFTGREDLLDNLHQQLNADSIVAVTQTQAIHGLGGVGKTQVAVEYAYRYQHEYCFVFWVVAASRDTLIADIVSIAAMLQIPEANEPDSTIVLAAFKRWLSIHKDWLLIFDNADELEVVRDTLPSATTGHILITTRAHAVRSLAGSFPIEQMGEEEGALLLLRRAGVLTATSSLAQASKDDQSQARAIVHVMGGLPLALDQAGAYIEETHCSLSSYLDHYHVHQRDLLERRGQITSDYLASVATTWSLSFKNLEKENHSAADLLRVCSFLAPEDIPEELFKLGVSELGSVLARSLKGTLELDKAIEAVLKYSLLQRNLHTSTLSIHRLVQAVLKMEMSQEAQRVWAKRVVRAVSSIFPEPDVSTWPQCRRFLSHAQQCIAFIERYHWTFPEALLLLKRTGEYLHSRAQYHEAEQLYRHILAIREQKLGANHPDVSAILETLGVLYREQGRYKEAETCLQRSLAIREQMLGADHPETATALHDLGSLYWEQNRYKEAETCLQRSLAIREQMLGADHPDTAAVLYSLGLLYSNLGRLQEAENSYKRSLSIFQQVVVSNHYNIAYVFEGYALLLLKRGKVLQAANKCKQALDAIGVRRLTSDAWEYIRIYAKRTLPKE